MDCKNKFCFIEDEWSEVYNLCDTAIIKTRQVVEEMTKIRILKLVLKIESLKME